MDAAFAGECRQFQEGDIGNCQAVPILARVLSGQEMWIVPNLWGRDALGARSDSDPAW